MGLVDSFLSAVGLQRLPATEPQRTRKRKHHKPEPEPERERERTQRRSLERRPPPKRARRGSDVEHRGFKVRRVGAARFA
jgi:hypothetical protein